MCVCVCVCVCERWRECARTCACSYTRVCVPPWLHEPFDGVDEDQDEDDKEERPNDTSGHHAIGRGFLQSNACNDNKPTRVTQHRCPCEVVCTLTPFGSGHGMTGCG